VTFGDYVDRVAGAVDAADGPVTLVGHSMGGHVVTQVAEERPDAVGTVVYLAAFLPPDGRALTDLDPSGYGSVVPEYATRDAGRGVVTMDPAGAETAFYHDCGAEDLALGRSLLRPEPVAPRTVPVSLTTAGYGSVRRAYVECADDRALPVAFQRSMREAVPCDEVRTLGTGHSPFFAAPDDLRAVLEAVAVGAEG
jgi:pimeloyl-ACP methyl ester carboxylesterase